MKNKIIFIFSLASLIFMLSSCDLIFNVASSLVGGGTSSGTNENNTQENPVDPTSIKYKAYEKALQYMKEDTYYQGGGIGRAIPFDCSGFIARCYLDAIKGTNARVDFGDGNNRPVVSSLFENYTRRIDKKELQKGDLIFIDYTKEPGASGDYPNHVGIYDYTSRGKIYFIDASGYNEGYNKAVQRRHINENDRRIMGYGEVRIHIR